MADQTVSSEWDDLSGKVVMVTGASSGIGRDFCIDLAKAGCRIIAAARRIDRLMSLCDEINGSNGDVRAVAVELDVAAAGPAIESSVKRAWDAFGSIDCLINNAGVRGNVRNPLELSEEEWNSTIRTNLTGTWLVAKYVCTYMRDANQRGSIINISSISGLDRGDLPGGLAYSSSKAAVVTLTKVSLNSSSRFYNAICGDSLFLDSDDLKFKQVMAMELGAYNIRVNSINPGIFRSEITESLLRKDWLNKVVEKTVPLRTFGTVDPALTRLVRYLIHDSSKYITGNVFIVDAGTTLPGVPIFSSL